MLSNKNAPLWGGVNIPNWNKYKEIKDKDHLMYMYMYII